MSQDKDELAKLLGEMAAGEHADADAAHHEDDDHIGHLAEAPPTASAPAPPGTQPTPAPPVAKAPSPLPPTPPRPQLQPPAAKPASPPAQTSPLPPRPPVKPALPPRPAPVAKPQPPVPAPTSKPLFTPPAPVNLPTPNPEPPAPIAAPTPILADEEEPERYSGTDDDAVIVPALAPSDFIPHRPSPPRRQHLSQKLYFKQTIIPILLTLGLICLAIPTLGLLTSQYSPFKSLAEPYFMFTFWPLGLAFLVFAILTILSVKKQLEPAASTPPAAD